MENELTPDEITGKEKAQDFINEVKDIKDKMIPKEEYQKLVEERDKLKHALLTGVVEKDDEPIKSVDELRKDYSEIIKAGSNNLKGFETALKLREAVINETGKDPFMTEALQRIDPAFGERVAESMQDIVEKSDNSPNMFNAILSQNLR